MINNLSLEEVIALKLEMAAISAGRMMYGIPIYQSLTYIIRDAIIKYVYSATNSLKEAARMVGVNEMNFRKLVRYYRVNEYFENKKQKLISDNDKTN
jgi:hypothetical protein